MGRNEDRQESTRAPADRAFSANAWGGFIRFMGVALLASQYAGTPVGYFGALWFLVFVADHHRSCAR
jgi:hypothetical protein